MKTDRDCVKDETKTYLKTASSHYVDFKDNPAIIRDLAAFVLNRRGWLFGVDDSIKTHDDFVSAVREALFETVQSNSTT